MQTQRTAAAAGTAVCAVVCLLAAGCGSLRAGGRTGAAAATGLAAASPTGRTAAGNSRLARRQARHLLSLARLPGRAVRLSSAPRSPAGPAMGTPEVTSLVDLASAWRVAMPYAQAVAWIRTHPPRGLRASSSSGGLPPVAGFGYDGPASRAWQSAELDIEVAPAGQGTSVIRADGVVVWLDPVPQRDTDRGRRIRVRVAAGCPASDAGYVGVTNHGGDLGHRLLPRAAPVSGLECRYDGMNGPAWRLRGATRLSPAAARRVARSMTALQLSHTEGGIMSCPMDDGSANVIALSYAGRADVDLWVNATGCGGVSNGYIVAGFAG